MQFYKKLIQWFFESKENEFLKPETIHKQKLRIQRVAKDIIVNYLEVNSVNELNIASIKNKRNELLAIIQQFETSSRNDLLLPCGLFDQVLVESFLTMNDVYVRLKYHSKTIREFAHDWHKTQQEVVNKTNV